MEEPIDKWLNERLEDLPETVPFDPEALWKSVQQAQKAPRKRRWTVPAAAALVILAGLVTASLFHDTPQANHVAATPPAKAAPAPEVPVAVTPQVPLLTHSPAPSRKPAIKTRPSVTEPVAIHPAEEKPADIPQAEVVPLPDVAVAVPAPASPAVVAQPTTKPGTAKASRPRFRISHINDLREEEETRAKVYKSESFVRMGISEVSPGPAPSLSTRNKQF
ncbi:hypothetical protein [Siphonobacter aquaeclarae]|uniref:Uncharacterized protein n=1 Tax=Siphonobacter aquaeclarae TaxID=563176 RepID=A0A1G9V3B8_9BACT|nr:hypothetical protein [Siphonobacter aquaeclarae]SDM66325.1 hypothetical protein SAMN04488090_3939 [Siphonobacter aquaeclarae]